ncbi:MAG: 1-deoxy-D-xylulose-5-phosphate synthase [Dehalococcoidia bacterium]
MARLLDQIHSPEDLRPLSYPQLQQLAREVREELLATVNTTGGHLASNLGVVELTLALHRVFDSPRDRIIWDVGHQSYVHKLVTGRLPRFGTLRQADGLSGFCDPAESPHDPFISGHASTSISAALGMAVSRDLAGEDSHVVAVIGDGALTGGMAFEALNQAGHLGNRLLVVLNDNGMAISPSVGGVAHRLNLLRVDYRYLWAKARATRLSNSLPGGRHLWRVARGLKNNIKGLLLPRALWEGMGLNYIGPVDGHNLRELETVLRQLKDSYQGPTLLHVVTVKGKGSPPAEGNPEAYHGISPPGDKRDGMPTYSQVFTATMLRLMRQNPQVVAVTAAMSTGTGLDQVTREFPHRVFDVGICEQHAVTFAAGLATRGLVPVVAIYSTFLQRAFDQVIHDVCLQNLPVVLALDRSGIVGDDGKTHQGTLDLSYLCPIPNLTVAAPADENELQNLLFTAVSAGRPMAIRYPRGWGSGVPLDEEPRELPVGQGEELRPGNDVAVVALGSMVAPALEAAALLAEQGVEATVINARYAKPLDAPLILEAAQRTSRLVTVEENVLQGGFGTSVLRLLNEHGLGNTETVTLGIPDEFVDQGLQTQVRHYYGLDAEGIARSTLAAFPQLSLPARRASRR